MISSMRTPPEEFGRLVRQLRKQRKMTAEQVSLACGVSKNYIGQWERGETKVIKRAVIVSFASVIGVTDAQRAELFRLADRHGETIASIPVDIQLNISESLSALPVFETQSGASQPDIGLPATRDMAEACGWLLAYWAARSGVPHYSPWRVAFPNDIVTGDSGIITRDADAPNSAYYDFSRSEATGSPWSWDTPLDHKHYADSDTRTNVLAGHVTALYRVWLFSDLSRCMEICARLSHWAYQFRSVSSIAWLRFRESMYHDVHGIDGVSCNVIARVNQRRLERLIADRRDRRKIKPELIHVYDRIDQWPRTLGHMSQRELAALHSAELSVNALLAHLQIVTDAIYTLSDHDTWNSETWWNDYHVPMVQYPLSRSFSLKIAANREKLIQNLVKVRTEIFKRLKKPKKLGTRDGLPFELDRDFVVAQNERRWNRHLEQEIEKLD